MSPDKEIVEINGVLLEINHDLQDHLGNPLIVTVVDGIGASINILASNVTENTNGTVR